ncbi:MAG: hypothetical protein ACXWQZ_13085, partial [Ktedonobacterales bacterium]
MDTRSSIAAPRTKSSPAIMLARFALLAIIAAGALAVLAACSTASATPTVATTRHLTFDILPVKPGGPANDWPAYIATSPTALP